MFDALFASLPPTPDGSPIYLDHAATTPVDPRVAELVMYHMLQEFGNAGSRHHTYGAEALKAVNKARQQVADVVNADPTGVIFTSGATESNNLAIFGLTQHSLETGRKHMVATAIEHKAVLEPLKEMERRGFEITLIEPNAGGWVEPERILSAVRPDTLLVSVMHVNNETGIIQPLAEIAAGLEKHDAFLHTDAAQGFGKELDLLKHTRIDMISLSGHKIRAPKGIGALIMRRRRYKLPPLTPLLFGGGQERGLRSGTQPVQLIAGLGLAAELCVKEHAQWLERATAMRAQLWAELKSAGAVLNGDPARCLPSILSFSIPGVDSEAFILGVKRRVAISNGAACGGIHSSSMQANATLRVSL